MEQQRMPGLIPKNIWADYTPPNLVQTDVLQYYGTDHVYPKSCLCSLCHESFSFGKFRDGCREQDLLVLTFCSRSPAGHKPTLRHRGVKPVGAVSGHPGPKGAGSGCRRAAAARIWAGEGEDSGSLANEVTTNEHRGQAGSPCWGCSACSLNRRALQKKSIQKQMRMAGKWSWPCPNPTLWLTSLTFFFFFKSLHIECGTWLEVFQIHTYIFSFSSYFFSCLWHGCLRGHVK